MAQRKSRRSRGPLFGLLLILLLMMAFWLPGGFLAGILDGGGRRDTNDLQVTVLSAGSRAPIVGARILVDGLQPQESDASGSVLLTGMPAGPVRVTISHGGREFTTWARRAEGRIVVEMAPDSLRVGTLTDASGNPVQGTVHLFDRDGDELATGQSDESGRYELPDLPKAHSISANGAGLAPAVVSRGDMRLDAGQVLAGRLIGATTGLLEVFGRMPEPDDDGMLPFYCRWRVNADGSYSGRLGAGVRTWAIYDGLPIRLLGGEQELPRAIEATGVVRRADGSPASRATLSFRPLLDADFPVPLPPVRVVANEAGRFATGDLADVRYAVEVSAAGCANLLLNDVKPVGLKITLEVGYSVAGRIVDEHGQPIVGAELRAFSQPDATGRHPIVRARSGVRGRFLLEGLAGEFARVQVTATGFLPLTLDRVEPASTTKAVLTRG